MRIIPWTTFTVTPEATRAIIRELSDVSTRGSAQKDYNKAPSLFFVSPCIRKIARRVMVRGRESELLERIADSRRGSRSEMLVLVLMAYSAS